MSHYEWAATGCLVMMVLIAGGAVIENWWVVRKRSR